MLILNLVLTTAGLISLALSIKPACEIQKADKNHKWKLLCSLLFAFILGYFFIFYFLITGAVDNYIGFALASILAGGGLFVNIVIGLSLKSIKKISNALQKQKYLAEHDSITDQFNRSKLIYDLNYKIEKQKPFYLMLFGIKNFKQIIDIHDYEIVEALLHQFGDRIFNSLINFNFKLYRIDGDEFALLIDNTADTDINAALQSIEACLSHDFKVINLTLQIDMVAGISQYPSMTTQGKKLFKQANLAFHEARLTRNKVIWYFKELGERSENTIKIHDSMKSALNKNEFELYFQPIIDAMTGEVEGAESLIRWPKKDGTFINPDLFIPIAEKSEIINDISRWVVIEAINALNYLKQEGFNGSIHINLSTKDLESQEFYDFLKRQADENPNISSSIVFEITEHAMMKNFSDARDIMENLSSMGFSFSIDDFGTGFSSMTLLKELPISQIKIDRSFISDMMTHSANFSIVESTLFLASKLGCTVVAEGVETLELQKKLCQMGCHLLQGYHFSKPLPIRDYTFKYIRKHPCNHAYSAAPESLT